MTIDQAKPATRWPIWPGRGSEGGFPDVELLLVVVPELAPRDDLAEGVRTLEGVAVERAPDLGELLRTGVGDDRVVAQLGDLAADVDDPLVHGVGQRGAGVAADDDA